MDENAYSLEEEINQVRGRNRKVGLRDIRSLDRSAQKISLAESPDQKLQTLPAHRREHSQGDPNKVIIRNLPPNARYLTHNVFGKEVSPPRESVQDALYNIRSIFYSEMNMRNKREESQKLKEFIKTEYDKLYDAQKTFQEDCERFDKYMREMQQLTIQAREKTEQAMKKKLELQDKIVEIERENMLLDKQLDNIDDELKECLHNKDFIDTVKACRSHNPQKDGRKPLHKNKNVDFFLTEQNL